jgi:hypothetical protein
MPAAIDMKHVAPHFLIVATMERATISMRLPQKSGERGSVSCWTFGFLPNRVNTHYDRVGAIGPDRNAGKLDRRVKRNSVARGPIECYHQMGDRLVGLHFVMERNRKRIQRIRGDNESAHRTGIIPVV